MTTTRTHTQDRAVPVSYQFGVGTATGVWLGLGVGRVALVGTGLLASILTLTLGAPMFVAVLPGLVCAGLAAARVAGRPTLDWVTPLVGHRSSAVTGETRWRAPFPVAPTHIPPHGERLRLPPEYGRLRLRDCDDDPSVGLLVDSRLGTVTAVFDVAGIDRFPLLDPADRDGLIAGWGQSLAVLADTDDTLVRLQLIERATHPGPTDIGADGPRDPVTEQDVLRCTVDALATCHDSRLAVQWSPGRIDPTTLATISGRCRGVSQTLLTARLLTRPLSSPELRREVATALRGSPPSDSPITAPGPISRRSNWSHVVTDETYHRSYAITGWPAGAVAADWLAPLLLVAPVGVTRTVAIHLQRVPPAAAARTARTARAKAMLDQRDRVRLGMTTSAAIDNAETAGVAMDTELAAGYRTHQLTALVTLSTTDPHVLDGAARVMRQAAAAARLELRPLHGQHDRALAATLPLCRVRPGGQS